jgi:hypothetical protein
MPRLLLARLGFGRLKEPEDLEEKIKVLETKMMKLAHELVKNGTRPDDFFQSDKLPHEIAVTRPIAPWDNVLDMQGNPPPFFSEKREISEVEQSGVRTQHLMQLVHEACQMYSADKALQIFTYLEGSAIAKGFLGHLFERLVHNKFTKGYRARELRPLSEDVDEVLLPATNPGCLEFDTLDFLSRGIRLKEGSPKVKPELEAIYLKPTAKNLPAVDSLFYTKTGNTYSVFFLQITVSLDHNR